MNTEAVHRYNTCPNLASCLAPHDLFQPAVILEGGASGQPEGQQAGGVEPGRAHSPQGGNREADSHY